LVYPTQLAIRQNPCLILQCVFTVLLRPSFTDRYYTTILTCARKLAVKPA